ncbi:hypothetical protein CPLU01_10864 [Colletotrichum plurivorum]|uniref:Ankyrin repeat protein n=1 Tax=Colletotrichum plurivorum TaxID=2175906 RepID=A0A8H6N9B1_9PEZI|nr:hypothetical protein CPLU01_10864 [Colletotrichum plurivorum]
MKVAVIDMPWEKNVRARAKLKPSEYSPLYCAAWYGLEHVVEWITLQGTITEAPCGLFGHPLQAAAKRAICAAASEGHTNIVRELLAAGSLAQPFIHGVFDDRRTDPLYLAVEKGSLEIVELLLAHGATDYRALKANPASALECATQDGRLDIVKELLRHNGVLSPNSKSKVPHMFPSGFAVSQSSASELGHKDILRELAKHEMGPSDKSALVSAASAGSLAVCEELLDRGANPNFKSLTAAISGKNLDVVRLLVDAGADITPPGRGPICEAVVRQQWKIVDFLAGKGADLHLALKDAVLHGDSEAFKEIIKLGAVINRHGCEILQESARGGSVVIIAYFLEMGMDVDSTSDSSRIRPLIQAIRSKKWKAMRFLLDRGADINAAALARHEQPDDAKNDIGTPAPGSIEVHGETPLAEAAKVGAENICLELIQRGAIVRTDSPAASSTPLLYAISEHLSRLFDELLQRGADPNQRGTILSAYCPKPTTPLLLAIEKRDISALHRLMAAGADVNGQDPEGLSPLHRAAGIRSSSRTKKTNDEGEDTDILKHLIHKYHADVNGPRLLNGSLPIHSAGSRGRVEHVQIMLDAGADVNALNNAGRTPMHWAAERGRWDVVELLLDRGADPQIKSTEASLQTAWDLAQAARDQPLWKVRAIKGWDNARIEALLERLEGIKEE